MLYLVVNYRTTRWTFKHWPNHENLADLTDGELHTCIKFTSAQLHNTILLKSRFPTIGSHAPIWRLVMFSKNLAVSPECDPSILVMTQVGVSDITDEALCRPFCGKLMRGNVSVYSAPYPIPTKNLELPMTMDVPEDWDVVVVTFPCEFHDMCRGLFIHMTQRAFADTVSDLELCEIGRGLVDHPWRNIEKSIDIIQCYIISSRSKWWTSFWNIS